MDVLLTAHCSPAVTNLYSLKDRSDPKIRYPNEKQLALCQIVYAPKPAYYACCKIIVSAKNLTV